MPLTAALARLTENEKQCLRRRLRHQTAKEMAIDLGISPHAVEKRLKMARAKLGVSSSLAAARLLDDAERYGPAVPRPADLSGALPPAHSEDAASPGRRLFAGGSSMLIACLAALIAQDVPSTSSPMPVPPGSERIEDVVFRPASPDEVRAFVRDSFRTMDKDGSGYIERAEAPDGGIFTGEADAKPLIVHGRVGQAMTIAQADTDGDGRISEAEFVASRTPMFIARGVPANWRGAKAAAAAAAPSGHAVHLSEVATRKVGMDEAAAFNAEEFRRKDRDGSGYLDPAEASAMEPRDADRDKSLPPAPPAGTPDVAAARKWMAKLDTDRDGKVSEGEYVAYMMPWTLWQGVPAAWKPAGH